MLSAKYHRRLAIWCALVVLSLPCSYYTALLSVRQQLNTYLQESLTMHVNDALQSSIHDLNNRRFIVEQINQHISQWQTQAVAGHFLSGQLTLLDWQTNNPLPQGGPDTLNLQWDSGPAHHQMQFKLSWQLDTVKWLQLQGLLAVLLLIFLLLFPQPLSARQRDWQLRIGPLLNRNTMQVSLARISALSAQQYQWLSIELASNSLKDSQLQACLLDSRFYSLTTIQFDWLLCALNQPECSAEQAMSIACAPAELVFLPQQVQIHGLVIPMAKTPLLYYRWYAQQRWQNLDEGWLLNPATNKADLPTGAALANFMRAHQGHSRAINDLEQNGLTPKKLDQNRNRIRETLCAVLGEALAEPYLFESKRDIRSGRFAHRIAVDIPQILISNR
ncbi:hypothetical protein GCM10009092_13570 [Bowmanella denitrificans]|uniref:Uncharacterized protein n=1 Tax=Bowmanella denitrificans TaxID=366582 RepID=A0ABN0WYM1_9ALTE